MPRKKLTTAVGTLTISAVVGYFSKASIEVAEAALELATSAVRERRMKAAQLSRAHKPGTAAGPAGVEKVGTAQPAAAAADTGRKKPGPAKGTKRQRGARGGTATAHDENTGADLPPQTTERAEAVDDLPLSDDAVVDVS